jgi:hypothetical protein
VEDGQHDLDEIDVDLDEPVYGGWGWQGGDIDRTTSAFSIMGVGFGRVVTPSRTSRRERPTCVGLFLWTALMAGRV